MLYKLRFLQYLVYQMAVLRRSNLKNKRAPWEIKISMEDLAYWLRMASFIEEYKGPQLRAMLNQFYADGKAIGYLKSYKIDVERKSFRGGSRRVGEGGIVRKGPFFSSCRAGTRCEERRGAGGWPGFFLSGNFWSIWGWDIAHPPSGGCDFFLIDHTEVDAR